MQTKLSTGFCLVVTAAVLLVRSFTLPTSGIVSSTAEEKSISAASANASTLGLSEKHPKQLSLPDFRLCRATFSVSDRSYICQGPAYDDFADRMLRYAQQQGSPTWGRRTFPLPNNTYVFMLGNSHTRQVYDTLFCEYRDAITSTRFFSDVPEADKLSFGRTRSVSFANNATLVTVSNTPLVYNKDLWVKTFETLLGKPLASMDTIIMGRFNDFENRSQYGRDIIAKAREHPELFGQDFSFPTIESLAAIFEGPIIAVPMFATQGQDVLSSAYRAQSYWKNKTGRTNIATVEVRRHIDILGECGSDLYMEVGICRNHGDGVEGRDPSTMHRCTGMKGGHPDLVSWDIIERLHELLPLRPD